MGRKRQFETESGVYGLTYCNFPGWGAAPLTDEYLSDINDILRNRAIEQGKDDSVKWTSPLAWG